MDSATAVGPRSQEKRLGIIGGMSWSSTVEYYRLINQTVNKERGRQRSAEIIIASVDFQPIVDAQVKGDWASAGNRLAERAQDLAKAGASAFLIASNTMHKVYDQVRRSVTIEGLNIFDATAAAVHAARCSRVGLLGTRYTMSDHFYRDEYSARGITIVTPRPDDSVRVNDIIFKELIHNTIRPESADFFRGVTQRLADAGVQGVILGCTEISLLLQQEAVDVPLFDTTALHAAEGAKWLLGRSTCMS